MPAPWLQLLGLRKALALHLSVSAIALVGYRHQWRGHNKCKLNDITLRGLGAAVSDLSKVYGGR